MKSRLPEGFGKQKSMAEIVKEAQKMQEKMEQVKLEVKEKEFSAVAGGSAVEAVANGAKELVRVLIKPEVVSQDDVEMLQDLIVAAVNASLKKASEYYESRMNEVTGNLNIPGMN